MERREIRYEHGGVSCVGVAVSPPGAGPHPAVLVCHDWSGRNAMALESAERMAREGYVGFALDMYGEGRVAERVEDKAALMAPLKEDRALLIARVRAGFDAMVALPEADATSTAAIGFCFGGMCVLDLARSGAPVGGVVSLHGLLESPADALFGEMRARVLVLHGYRDPMVSHEHVAVMQRQFADAGVDFQLHSHGRAVHAFTNPKASVPGTAEYDELTARRAFRATYDFLAELFQHH